MALVLVVVASCFLLIPQGLLWQLSESRETPKCEIDALRLVTAVIPVRGVFVGGCVVQVRVRTRSLREGAVITNPCLVRRSSALHCDLSCVHPRGDVTAHSQIGMAV